MDLDDNGEPLEIELPRFLAYLEYRGCEKGNTYLAMAVVYRNPRNGVEVTVLTTLYMVPRMTVWWACHDLGINLPDEFTLFQQSWDGLAELHKKYKQAEAEAEAEEAEEPDDSK